MYLPCFQMAVCVKNYDKIYCENLWNYLNFYLFDNKV